MDSERQDSRNVAVSLVHFRSRRCPVRRLAGKVWGKPPGRRSNQIYFGDLPILETHSTIGTRAVSCRNRQSVQKDSQDPHSTVYLRTLLEVRTAMQRNLDPAHTSRLNPKRSALVGIRFRPPVIVQVHIRTAHSCKPILKDRSSRPHYPGST